MTGKRLSGGCLCGAIRFEAVGAPSVVSNCHCTMCRRASGAAFIPFAAYGRADVHFTQGEPAQFQSSAEAVRGFCPHCGTSLFFVYLAEPERIWVTLGSFDDPTAHRPVEDWYVDIKMPWVGLDEATVHWPAAPGWVAEVTGRQD